MQHLVLQRAFEIKRAEGVPDLGVALVETGAEQAHDHAVAVYGDALHVAALALAVAQLDAGAGQTFVIQNHHVAGHHFDDTHAAVR